MASRMFQSASAELPLHNAIISSVPLTKYWLVVVVHLHCPDEQVEQPHSFVRLRERAEENSIRTSGACDVARTSTLKYTRMLFTSALRQRNITFAPGATTEWGHTSCGSRRASADRTYG